MKSTLRQRGNKTPPRSSHALISECSCRFDHSQKSSPGQNSPEFVYLWSLHSLCQNALLRTKKMSATTAMDINAEARRILAVSISKLYASRTQRGGLRLHRSLLLSMVMRSARDIYHSSRENEGTSGAHQAPEEPMDTGSNPAEQTEPAPHVEPQSEPCATEPINDRLDDEVNEDKENLSPSRHSRKRRGKTSVAPDFLPSKRARLEPGEERYATPVGSCRAADSLTALSLNRVIPAF